MPIDQTVSASVLPSYWKSQAHCFPIAVIEMSGFSSCVSMMD